IFISLLARTTSQIRDVHDADIWVMDPNVRYVEETYALSDMDVHRVRGVEGVAWAVRFYKGNIRCRLAVGNDSGARGDFRQVGMPEPALDTLVGPPGELVLGSWATLKHPVGFLFDDLVSPFRGQNNPPRPGGFLEKTAPRAVLEGF